MSDGITGMGTIFERGDGADPEVFTAVANVFNINGPGMTRETVETTTYDAADGYREKIGGLRDGGTVTFSMNFTQTGYLLLLGDFEDDEPVNYKIKFPDTASTVASFSGLVTELPPALPEGDRITVDVTIEITAKPTIAAEST